MHLTKHELALLLVLVDNKIFETEIVNLRLDLRGIKEKISEELEGRLDNDD